MKFRSIGVYATNKRDYLTRIKEVENDYIKESTLAHIGFISFEDQNIKDELNGPNSLYKLTAFKTHRRKKRKIIKPHYYRKKLYFYHQTKIDSTDDITLINE